MNRFKYLTKESENVAASITERKRQESAEISRQIDEFIAKGGRIEVIPYGLYRSHEEVSSLAKAVAHTVTSKEKRQMGGYK